MTDSPNQKKNDTPPRSFTLSEKVLLGLIPVLMLGYVFTAISPAQIAKNIKNTFTFSQPQQSAPQAQTAPTGAVLQSETTSTQEVPGFMKIVPALIRAFNNTGLPEATETGDTPVGGGSNTGGGTIPPIGDLVPPPGTLKTIAVGNTTYYQMPTDDLYVFNGGACPAQRYGSKELVTFLYNIASRYNDFTQGQDRLRIHDLNASGHKSHKWGVAVDLSLEDMAPGMMNHPRYDREKVLAATKMFLDTRLVKNIWYCDGYVTDRAKQYARENDLPFTQIKCLSGHRDHWHVDINTPRGASHTPSC